MTLEQTTRLAFTAYAGASLARNRVLLDSTPAPIDSAIATFSGTCRVVAPASRLVLS